MPACPYCRESVPASDLRPCNDTVVCSKCSTLRLVPEEAEMSEKKDCCSVSASRTQVFSLSVSEYEDGNGVDHVVDASFRTGGISMEFHTTVDKIRKFFTEKREKANLKSVP